MRAFLALALLAAGLAGVVGLELYGASGDDAGVRVVVAAGSPPGIAPAMRQAAGRQEAGLRPPLANLHAQWAAEALGRPLFNKDRRQVSQPAGPANMAAGMPRLAGVIIHKTERSVILVPADGGKPVVAREGSQVAGVTVQEIKPGQVTVLGPAGVGVLRISYDPRPRQTAQPAPGAGPLALSFNAGGNLAPASGPISPLPVRFPRSCLPRLRSTPHDDRRTCHAKRRLLWLLLLF